jgi:hypothetical protein
MQEPANTEGSGVNDALGIQGELPLSLVFLYGSDTNFPIYSFYNYK